MQMSDGWSVGLSVGRSGDSLSRFSLSSKCSLDNLYYDSYEDDDEKEDDDEEDYDEDDEEDDDEDDEEDDDEKMKFFKKSCLSIFLFFSFFDWSFKNSDVSSLTALEL